MKTINAVRRFGGRFAAVGAVASVAAAPAFATYEDITSAVSPTDVITGVFAIAAVIAGILAVRMGVRKVLSMIK